MREVEIEEYRNGQLIGTKTVVVPDVPMSQERIQRAAALTLLAGAEGAPVAVQLTALKNAIKALAADTGV